MSVLGEHWRGGGGEPLLLIHGFSATRHVWGPVPRHLAERGFDVLVPTLAGHTGGPPLPPGDGVPLLADWLEEVLDEAGWARAHLAGFSLGGWLSLELAKRGRARTVTAIAPGGARTERDARESRRIRRLFRTSHLNARAVAGRAHRLARSRAFRRFALRDQMVEGALVSSDEAARMIRDFVRTPVFRRFLAQVGTAPGLVGLESVDVPVTILWGEHDRVLPQCRHEPYFRRSLPAATFRTLRHAGHVPFWEAPREIVEAIVERAGARVPAA
jgi:pimeloyl-ACP methyl ester carboxylesterase